MSSLLLNTVLAASMFAAQKSATDCFTYFPTGGESFGYSSDDAGGATSYLGVDTRNITAERLSELQLKDENGVEVTMVDQDAPAGKAGIREHDVILTVNGAAVQSVEQLRRMIREIPPGRVVALGISRAGQPMTVKAELADRKNTFISLPAIQPMKAFKMELPSVTMLPDMDIPVSVVVVHSSARSGLMVENLTPQLGMYFGAKNGEGVLVRSVEKGSAAEKAGFHAGDVIVRVNGDAVTDTGDFGHTLRSGKENTVSVVVIRDKKEQTLTLTLPDRKHSELFEESFESPDIEIKTQAALASAQSTLAQVEPAMQNYAEAIKRMQPEMERINKQIQEQQLKIQKGMEKARKDWTEHENDFQKLNQMIFLGGKADI
jgi:serine protease Do